MYSITVELIRVVCRDTESIHSSDKFALAGSVFTEAETRGVYFPMMRINEGEQRSLGVTDEFTSGVPRVGIALTGWDLDENDSWKDNEADLKEGAAAVAAAVATIPGYGIVASAVISGASAAIAEAVDTFNGWDHNDRLLDRVDTVDPPAVAPYVPVVVDHPITFSHDDAVGYSSWDYTIDVRITCEWKPSFSNTYPSQTDAAAAMRTFRQRADAASAAGLVGAFPTFFEATYGKRHVGGAVVFAGGQAEWRDVPIADLLSPNLDDFGLRMRATQDYAGRNGFVGGFPNFYHADNGADIVCGTVLLPATSAGFRTCTTPIWPRAASPEPS
jgi:hypothetical protein